MVERVQLVVKCATRRCTNAVIPAAGWIAYCQSCLDQQEAQRLARLPKPAPGRPVCSCEHYMSLHVESGCAVCGCATVGTGEPATRGSTPLCAAPLFQRVA